MIPDIGWVELLVIAAVAIIVVGPKDLPRLMRLLGGWLGKARGLVREFQSSFDELVRESELDDLRREVEELRNLNPLDDVKKALDPTDELRNLDRSLKDEMGEVDKDMKEEVPEQDEDLDLSTEQTDLEAKRALEPEGGDETGVAKP